MGYTNGLRFKAVIKSEYRKYINEVVNGDIVSFIELYNTYPNELPFLKEFVETKDYADSIGFSSSTDWMPNTWSVMSAPIDSVSYRLFLFDFNEDTGIYQFTTVNKNKDNSMEFFVENVAPHLVEKVIAIYTHNDQESIYRCYDLVDGKIVNVANIEVDSIGYSFEIIETIHKSFELTDTWKHHLDWDESRKPEQPTSY